MTAPVPPEAQRHAELLAVLRKIEEGITALVVIARGKAEARVKAQAGAGPKIASDADLDGAHGDPEIKAKDPRDWTGPSMIGRHFSECPAEYLEMVAERKDYFVSQNPQGTDDEKKKATYDRLDAARARGWAERIRSGKHKPKPVEPQRGFDDDPTSTDF